MPQFLILFRNNLRDEDFRLAEIAAVKESLGVKSPPPVPHVYQWDENDAAQPSSSSSSATSREAQYPFYVAEFSSEEEARLVCTMCSLVKICIRVWSHGRSLAECVASVEAAITSQDSAGVPATGKRGGDGGDATATSDGGGKQEGSCTVENAGSTARAVVSSHPPPLGDPVAVAAGFRADVETFGYSLNSSRKREVIDSFAALGSVLGPAKLSDPDVEVLILIDYTLNIPEVDYSRHRVVGKRERKAERKRLRQSGEDGAGEPSKKPAAPTEPAPQNVFIGRLVCRGDHSHWKRYELTSRPFVGTTSMAPEFALLMARQGLVSEGSLVLDPFVGTGSVLVSCASLGAIVIGADRDPRSYNPRGLELGMDPTVVSAFTNFDHYGLSPGLDITRMDVTRPAWRAGWLDAIVTDPPYGIRAGSRVATSPGTTDSLPSSVVYPVPKLIDHLLELAAHALRPGGRLVFFMPTIESAYDHARDAPRHPALREIRCSKQWLHGFPPKDVFRRLITMEKL